MATPNSASASIQQHADSAACTAVQHEKERYSTVMQHPATRGREALAINLLGVTGPSEMTAYEIIKALEKAPLPVAEAAPLPAQSSAPQSPHEAAMTHLGLTPRQIEFERDYARGAEAARYLLGK